MPISGAGGIGTATGFRNQFIAQILAICGDTRLLWLPKPTDTTTSTDESLNGRTLTYDATIAARLSGQGLGQMVSFSGAQYATAPDDGGLSFGNGSTDSAFSIVVLANVTDTAGSRSLVTKAATNDFSGNAAEWEFQITSDDKLRLYLWDDSATVVVNRLSNAAITQGSPRLFAATYSGTGGASAANGIVLYQDAVVVASTATNEAAYVAMEDTGSELAIGATYTHAFNRFAGSMGLALICAKALSAHELWALKKAVNGYFGLSL